MVGLLSGLLFARRLKRGKEDRARLPERRGYPAFGRPSAGLAWVHAASVGETIAVLPLIAALRARGLAVLLTTHTVTSARLAADRLPPGAFHQFIPIDVPAYVRRFLDHWRPDIGIFAESDLWPNLIVEAHQRGIPLVISNARMSDRSYKGWQRARGTISALLSCFDLCLAQSVEDAARYEALGAPRVLATGNLKFDVPPPPADPAKLSALRTSLAGRPVFAAASTHPGEDEQIIEAHQQIARTYPDLITLIAPRHPSRGEAVMALAEAASLPAVQRSRGLLPDKGTAVYVADTIGELGLIYRLAPVVFVGGSLIRHGGQNPIEPAKLRAAILHGPNVGNFAAVYQALARNRAAGTVTDAGSLAVSALRLMGEQTTRYAMIQAAETTVAGFSGALERTLSALDPYLLQMRLEARL